MVKKLKEILLQFKEYRNASKNKIKLKKITFFFINFFVLSLSFEKIKEGLKLAVGFNKDILIDEYIDNKISFLIKMDYSIRFKEQKIHLMASCKKENKTKYFGKTVTLRYNDKSINLIIFYNN